MISLLVHADQRPEHEHGRRGRDRLHVLERLRRHLPEALARHEHARRRSSARAPRRSAASCAGRARRGGCAARRATISLWISPNGTTQRSRAQLIAREVRDQIVRLVDARAARVGRAAEVHEVDAAPALHHAIGRDRRVDAARHETRHAAADRDRQPARARPLAARHVRRAAAGSRRSIVRSACVEIDAAADLLEHRRAEHGAQLRRRQRKRLVGAPRPHREGRERLGGARTRATAARIASRSTGTSTPTE